VILFIFGAVFFIAASVMVGSFLKGIACLMVPLPACLILLGLGVVGRRGGRDAGSGTSPFLKQPSGDDFSGNSWNGGLDFSSSSWNSGSLDIGSSDRNSGSRDFGSGSNSSGGGGSSGFN
jgi:hypothetical protein